MSEIKIGIACIFMVNCPLTDSRCWLDHNVENQLADRSAELRLPLTSMQLVPGEINV